MNIQEKIQKLKQKKNAVILAHTYQPGEIQELADFVGDSYGLSKKVSEVDADVIVFCGVKFMAETAAILNPKKTVLMPDPNAGCPMADMITGEQLRDLKKLHPDATVVCYVNSTAEVKAESDVCVTSSNAVDIVAGLDADKILFVPDRNLGRYVAKRTGKNIISYDGCCPVHDQVTAETVTKAKQQFPNAKVIVHPECKEEVVDLADFALSTGQMCELVQNTDIKEFIVGTECGIIYKLQEIAPDLTFHHLTPDLLCKDMKMTTPENLLHCLENTEPAITVPEEIAKKAMHSILTMLERTEQIAG